MKKILIITALSLLLGVSVSASVWQYGNYQERAMMAAECGIFGYSGTLEENQSEVVKTCFETLSGKSDQLGFSVATRYRTTLSENSTPFFNLILWVFTTFICSNIHQLH